MNSPSSFFGKCMTLLLGGVLSWYSIADPDGAKLAESILGSNRVPPSSAPTTSNAYDLPTVEAFVKQQSQHTDVGPHSPALARQPETPEQRMTSLSTQLRQLGASYLLVEKLTGEADERYRVRCDLASEHSPVKCCFEATQATPVSAMEEVLDAVRQIAGKTKLRTDRTLVTQT